MTGKSNGPTTETAGAPSVEKDVPEWEAILMQALQGILDKEIQAAVAPLQAQVADLIKKMENLETASKGYSKDISSLKDH